MTDIPWSGKARVHTQKDGTQLVILSKQEYDLLLDDSHWLSCLNAAGVDNWEGYDNACEIYQEDEE